MKNEFDHNYYLNHLDKFPRYLDKTDEQIKKSSRFSTVQAVVRLNSKLYIRILRLINFIFGDHHWYNEQTAYKAVSYYVKHSNECFSKDQQLKILDIFNIP